MVSDVLYQVSDLAGARRREFLDAAKRRPVALRDTDGSVLVMTTAARIASAAEASAAVTMIFAAEAALARTGDPQPVELGGLAWLADFDDADRKEALAELRTAVVVALTTEDPLPLRDALAAWETTARVMRDDARRVALVGVPSDDFVTASAPGGTDGG